ncbi:unnamed protein product [Darwinula stevensoni]|uniref:Uncharacterized protein n=1 Tax=Darwinula stevensoni TaxID=69355 RepID=A0A7R8XE92_9CRUS|nr:unnamed protein product [Darwinula stevensoni]CAG0894256.1 unnamed protein product [Darwinula stevensoni]
MITKNRSDAGKRLTMKSNRKRPCPAIRGVRPHQNPKFVERPILTAPIPSRPDLFAEAGGADPCDDGSDACAADFAAATAVSATAGFASAVDARLGCEDVAATAAVGDGGRAGSREDGKRTDHHAHPVDDAGPGRPVGKRRRQRLRRGERRVHRLLQESKLRNGRLHWYSTYGISVNKVNQSPLKLGASGVLGECDLVNREVKEPPPPPTPLTMVVPSLRKRLPENC